MVISGLELRHTNVPVFSKHRKLSVQTTKPKVGPEVLTIAFLCFSGVGLDDVTA
jgi:hypothetical protein